MNITETNESSHTLELPKLSVEQLNAIDVRYIARPTR